MASTPPPQRPTPGTVTLRYWASARAAAGVAEDRLEVAGAVTLADLADRARELHAGSERFSQVLKTCSALVGDRPVGTADPATVRVEPGQTVEFLPPFAGG